MREKASYGQKKNKRKSTISQGDNLESKEVKLYIPDEYRSRVLSKRVLEKLHEIASFTEYASPSNLLLLFLFQLYHYF